MKKKFFIFCFAILSLVLLLNLFSAAPIIPDELTKLSTITSDIKTLNWSEYLSELKSKALENEIIFNIDSFLTSVNPFFLVVFGTDYSMSLFMFFVIYFWAFFVMRINWALGLVSVFSKHVCLIISFGFTILLSHIQLYSSLSNLFIKLILMPKNKWAGALVLLGVLSLTAFVSALETIINKMLSKNKKLLEDEKEKINRKILDTYTKVLTK
jgi:hypothetical protein